jgi:hypothetical protein
LWVSALAKPKPRRLKPAPLATNLCPSEAMAIIGVCA